MSAGYDTDRAIDWRWMEDTPEEAAWRFYNTQEKRSDEYNV